jgi:hypothetical protein
MEFSHNRLSFDDRPHASDKVKNGMLSVAEMPPWHALHGSGVKDQPPTDGKKLVWSNAWVEVDNDGTMSICAQNGLSRDLALKGSRLDSVCGFSHVVIQPQLTEQAHPRNHASLQTYPPTPIFLKFANELEKLAWIDVLLLQGVKTGPGIQQREKQSMSIKTPAFDSLPRMLGPIERKPVMVGYRSGSCLHMPSPSYKLKETCIVPKEQSYTSAIN